MFRVKLAMVIIGGVLAFIGVQELRVSSGTTAEPVDVDLAAIESGEAVENNHWRLGEHVAVYGGCIYEYSQSKYDNSEPGPTTECKHCYYPVLSYDHDYMKGLAALVDKYGSTADAPEEEFPDLNGFKVLVKTKEFKTLGAIPDGMKSVDAVQGLVINRVQTLDSEEQGLLRQGFPGVNLDGLLIIEAGREPSSTLAIGGWIGGGALLAAAGLVLLLKKNRAVA